MGFTGRTGFVGFIGFTGFIWFRVWQGVLCAAWHLS